MPRTVELYLLRHAHAGDPARWTGPDDLRPLSGKGEGQADRLGRLLAARGFAPDAILTSPKVRAVRTAEIVAERLGGSARSDDRLAYVGGLDVLDAILRDAGDPERPLLIGHDPDFSDLLAELTGAPIPMKKGALARVDADRPLEAGRGVLRWLVPPDLLGGPD